MSSASSNKQEQSNRRSYRWLVYSIANFAFLVAVMLSAVGIAIPEIMRDFSIEADQMGQIISAYSYTYALMQIPGGILADRVGPRKTMTLFLLIGGSGILLFSQAPTFQLGLAGRVLTAFGVGVLYVNQIKVLRGWFAPNEFATAMGVGASINSIGGLVARPLLAVLVESLSWRIAFSSVGILTMLLAVAIWIIVRDRDPNLATPMDAQDPETDSQSSIWQSIRTVLAKPQFFLLFFIALLSYGGMMGVFFGWGLPFLMQGYSLSRVSAALVITTTSVFSLFTAPFWGRVSDKVLQARKPILRIGISGALLSYFILTFLAPQLSVLHLVLVFALLGSTASSLVISYTMVNELVPAAIAGVAAAMLNMGPYIGRGLYNALAGFILGSPTTFASDGTPLYSIMEYQSIFIPSVVAGILALMITFWLKETMQREASPALSPAPAKVN